MLRNANTGDALHRRRACHDPRAGCHQGSSLRIDQVLQLRRNLAPAIARAGVRFMAHSKALVPPSTLLHLQVIHSKDRGGNCHVRAQSSWKRGNNQRKRLLWLCVPPGNRFRWQNVEGRLPSNASSYRSRLTPAVIRCSGVAARWGRSVECRLQTLPLLPDRKRDQVLSRGKGCSTQSLPYTVSHRALHEPTVRKQFRFQLNSEFTPNFLSLATDSDEPGPANGVFA